MAAEPLDRLVLVAVINDRPVVAGEDHQRVVGQAEAVERFQNLADGPVELDYGLLYEPMKANMVFTVEPGIYLPDEGFGIRLEDDVVIQEKGEPFNMMGNIPIEADEIEEIMNS